MPFEINHVLTLFTPTYFSHKRYFPLAGKKELSFSFFFLSKLHGGGMAIIHALSFHAKIFIIVTERRKFPNARHLQK